MNSADVANMASQIIEPRHFPPVSYVDLCFYEAMW